MTFRPPARQFYSPSCSSNISEIRCRYDRRNISISTEVTVVGSTSDLYSSFDNSRITNMNENNGGTSNLTKHQNDGKYLFIFLYIIKINVLPII